MKRSAPLILLLGLLCGLIFGKLTVHVHPATFDGKIFYIGGRLLASGGNPYSRSQLLAGSERWAPEGMAAGQPAQMQLHFPATLVVFALFSWLPWPAFCWLLALLLGLTLPLIAWLCLRYFQPQPDNAALIAGTLLAAIVPATWQTFALGQVSLFTLLFILLTDRALIGKRDGLVVLFGFFALLKPTCCLPVLAVLFLREGVRGRGALVGAVLVNVAVNLLGALMIGPQAFLTEYREGARLMRLPGAPLDPLSGFRVDASVFLASFLHGAALTVTAYIVSAALCAGYYVVWKRSRKTELPDIAALLLLALLIFYHQPYDAALVAPALIYGYLLVKSGLKRPTDKVFAALLALNLMSFGNHNVVSLLLKPLRHEQPIYFKPLVLLLTYLALLAQIQQTRRERPEKDSNTIGTDDKR